MFTGIITDIGEVVERSGGRFLLRARYPAAEIAVGASIACDGVCLTVLETVPCGHGSLFRVEASNETLARTTLADWQPGRRINLEKALKAGDELGGHIVSGHVDGVAQIADIAADGSSRRFTIEAPPWLARFVAPKGSVALDGVSLTVNEVSGSRFQVNLIPHSLTETTWGSKNHGDRVNIEVDLIARYIARLMEFGR
jgi:riboflavin synthase